MKVLKLRSFDRATMVRDGDGGGDGELVKDRLTIKNLNTGDVVRM